MKSLFEYIDYRKFLRDYYNEKKKNTRHFSYRYFAQKTGINSPSFLKHVIDAERNLTTPAIDKFCKALNLNKKETVYFRHLVLFNQAKTSIEKQEHYKVLRSMSRNVKESILKVNQFDYFKKWYTVIIRELLCIYNFKDDFKLLAKSVIPPITFAEAKNAVKLLLDLDLVKKHTNGTYSQTNKAIVVEDSITSLAVRSFTENMLDKAKLSLHQINKSERHISGMTLGISKSNYDLLTSEIEAFKDRIKAIVNQDNDCSRVYQCNISLFPASIDINKLDKDKK